MIDYTPIQLKLMSLLNDAPKPRIPDAVDRQRLEAMQLVARMKESADKFGVGFVGGFISPDGQKFMMTNMDEVDTQALLPEDLK
jgi:selenophosphate synthetase-related protein